MKTLRQTLLVLVCLLVAGCFDLDEKITLHDDGSAQIELNWSAEKARADLASDLQTAASGQAGGLGFFDEKAMRNYLAKIPGVEIDVARCWEKDQVRHGRAILQVKDLRAALKAGLLPRTTLNFDKKTGLWTLEMKPDADLDRKAFPPSEAEAIRQIRMKLCFEVPGELISHNGHSKDGDKVTWEFGPQRSLLGAPRAFTASFKSDKLKKP
ncbi:MAG: hypothetical protein RL095_1065 [Verrucomicrobiota bacterium]|jgi:hypothetical protein